MTKELTAEVVKFISLVESLKAMCAREQDENARLRLRLAEVKEERDSALKELGPL